MSLPTLQCRQVLAQPVVKVLFLLPLHMVNFSFLWRNGKGPSYAGYSGGWVIPTCMKPCAISQVSKVLVRPGSCWMGGLGPK